MVMPSPRNRAGGYLEYIEEVSTSLLTMLEACSSVEWQSVGAMACQLARELGDVRELIAAVVAGDSIPQPSVQPRQPCPFECAAKQGTCGPEIRISLLRTSTAALGHVIGGLNDEQLTGNNPEDRAGQTGTLQALIETLVLGALYAPLSLIQGGIQSVPRTPGGIGKI